MMSRNFWLTIAGFVFFAVHPISANANESLHVKLVPAKKGSSVQASRSEPKATVFVFESGTRQDRWIAKHVKAGAPLTKAARVVRVEPDSPLRKKHGVKKGEARLILVNKRGQVRGHYSGPLAARLALEDARRGY